MQFILNLMNWLVRISVFLLCPNPPLFCSCSPSLFLTFSFPLDFLFLTVSSPQPLPLLCFFLALFSPPCALFLLFYLLLFQYFCGIIWLFRVLTEIRHFCDFLFYTLKCTETFHSTIANKQKKPFSVCLKLQWVWIECPYCQPKPFPAKTIK